MGGTDAAPGSLESAEVGDPSTGGLLAPLTGLVILAPPLCLAKKSAAMLLREEEEMGRTRGEVGTGGLGFSSFSFGGGLGEAERRVKRSGSGGGNSRSRFFFFFSPGLFDTTGFVGERAGKTSSLSRVADKS